MVADHGFHWVTSHGFHGWHPSCANLLLVIREPESDGVVTLQLAHGKASAIDLDLTEALSSVLERLARAGTRGLILTGTGGIFSAGVDLFKLVDGGRAYIDRFLPALDRMFEALFMFHAPVVAAVNGHAIAGGCILACTCDRRLMTTGAARIGVPELKVGVPFPPLVVEIMRASVAPPHFNELMYVGWAGRTNRPRRSRAGSWTSSRRPRSSRCALTRWPRSSRPRRRRALR
jgi:enoyl-CoA hydratase/carnithine racemase